MKLNSFPVCCAKGVLAGLALSFAWPLAAAEPVVKGLALWSFIGAGTLLNLLVMGIAVLLVRRSLRQRQRGDRMLLKQLPIHVGAADEEGNILYWQSEGMPKAPESVSPRRIDDLPSELLRELNPCIKRVFAKGKRFIHKYGVYGRMRQLEFFIVPEDVFGCRAVMWYSSDVTKLYRAMDTTTELAQRSQLILDSIVDAIVVTDCEQKITLINPAGLILLGCTEADVLNRKLEDVMTFRCPGPAGNYDPVGKVLLTGSAQKLPDRAVMVRRGGRELQISGNAAVMADSVGALSGVMLCFHNITELIDKQKQLSAMMDMAQSANQTKGRFIDAINHELRTPLNTIIGSSDLLVNGGRLSEEERGKCIAIINEAGKEMLHLINEILNLSRGDGGGETGRLEPTRLENIVSDFKWMLTGDEGGTGRVQFSNLGELPKLELDAARVRQLLVYMIGSVRYWHRDCTVALDAHYAGTENAPGELRITVTGTVEAKDGTSEGGTEQFFRNAVHNNVGIDRVSLDYMLAEQLSGACGGRLSIVGDDPIHLSLELSLPNIAQSVGERAITRELDMQEKHVLNGYVLLVDDTEMNLKVASGMLRQLKMSHLCCTSGALALEEIARKRPLAVIVDLWMPEMSGDALARTLRSDPDTEKLPIAVMTADTMITPLQEKLFNATLFKPVTRAMLRSCLEKLLPEWEPPAES